MQTMASKRSPRAVQTHMKLIERRATSPSIIDVDPYRPDSKTSSKQIENPFSDEEKFLDLKKTK